MIRKNVAEILQDPVTFELEAIDRMYLNADVPSLQTGGGFVYFVKSQLGAVVPSTMMVAPMSERFVAAIEQFVATQRIDLVLSERGQRKDDVAHDYLARFEGDEGVLFVGKAQEKANVFRTEKRRDAQGQTYPWIIRSTAMVNHYDVYILDRDFGPLFLKFCSYFPYPAKLCLNGHEWLTRQLTQRAIPFAPLDNGMRSSDQAGRVQRIADTLDAAKIDAVFRTWLRRVPHPFAPAHRAAGYHVAQLQSRDPDTYSAGAMTYDLRRLRLHGLIERVPRSHRYRITPTGAQVAMFYARLYTRALRPACSLRPIASVRAQRAFDRLDTALANFLKEVQLAA